MSRLFRERYAKPLVLVTLAIIAYCAAANRQQNLPWLIASTLASLTLVGVLWPFWLVSRLDIRRSGPTRAEEGETIHFEIEARNKGMLPRFMVEVTDRWPFNQGGKSDEEVSLGLIAYVPIRGTRLFQMPLVCEKRGFYQLGPVGLKSSFPLGLVEARLRKRTGKQSLTVFPDVFNIAALPLCGAPSQIHRGGYLLPRGNGAAEFSGLREYRRGDHPRFIHWPTTARLQELMVKEFEPLASACLFIGLDLSRETNFGSGRASCAEYAIRIAASMAQFCSRNNIRVRLQAEGERSLNIPSGYGEHHYLRVLDELAIADTQGRVPYAQVLQRMSFTCLDGESVVVFISQSMSTLEPVLEKLAIMIDRGAHLVAIVFDRGSFSVALGDTSRDTSEVAAAVASLGAWVATVKCGDDLEKVFLSCH